MTQPAGAPALLEWWAIPPSGTPVVLFDAMDSTVSVEAASRGTVSLTYPEAGSQYALLLANTLGADRDIECEIRIDGSTVGAQRAFLTDSSADEVGEGDKASRTWTGQLIGGQLLSETVIFNDSTSADGSVTFSSMTAGAIVSALVATAQARGALAGITVTTSNATTDSNGTAWGSTRTITLNPGGTYLSMLQEFEDAGWIEFELRGDRSLRVYLPGGMGVDRSATTPPVMLHAGRDVTAAPRKHTVANTVSAMLASGADGLYVAVSDSSAQARLGRRKEGYVSASGLASSAGLTSYATTQLARQSVGKVELEHELALADPATPRPLIDFGLRDFVLSDGTGQANGTAERLRVQQIVYPRQSGAVVATIVLGNLIAERDAALARQLERLANGTAVIGASEPPSLSADSISPNAPTGLTLGTAAFPDGVGGTNAAVFANWAAPATNTDGTVCNDLASYQLRWRYNAAGYSTNYNVVEGGSGLATDFGVNAVGVPILVAVRAVDRSSNYSAWSTPEVAITTGADTTGPPIPAAPTLYNQAGEVILAWTGLGSAGETQPPDFDAAVAYISTSSSFVAPGAGTRIGEIPGRGTMPINGLTYGVTYYVQLVSYDRSGNPSTGPSTTVSIVPTPVIGSELQDGLITAAKLGAGAVTGPKIFPEAVTTAHLSVASFLDTIIPNGDFEDVDLTTPTMPARWSLLSSTGSAPTVSRDTTDARVLGGAAALRVSLPAASGSARVGSAVIPARPGEVYLLQVPALGSRAVAGLRVYGYFDNANPPDPSRANTVVLLGAVPLTTAYATTDINFTVPTTVGASGSTSAPDWVRIVIEAGLVSGDSAALDVWVDQLRLRKVVGTAEIANAAISTAKIGLLQVTNAQMNDVSIAKLTSGSGTFSMLMVSGNIRSGDSGQRFILDLNGYRAYNSAGTLTADINNQGNPHLLTGTVRTGPPATPRVEINGALNEQRFYPKSGDDTQYVRMFATTSSSSDYLATALYLSSVFTGGASTGLTLGINYVQLYANSSVVFEQKSPGGSFLINGTASLSLNQALALDSDAAATLKLTTGTVTPSVSATQNNLTLQVYDSSVADRYGGFIYLNRGYSYFGYHNPSVDAYVTFGSSGALTLSTPSTLDINAISDLTRWRGYLSYGNNLGGNALIVAMFGLTAANSTGANFNFGATNAHQASTNATFQGSAVTCYVFSVSGSSVTIRRNPTTDAGLIHLIMIFTNQ